jgi:cell division septal protein FtsQ
MQEKIPLNRALLWIFLCTLLISGTAAMGWLYYLHLKKLRLHDPQYQIVAIVQTSSQKEVLKTAYLAELLGLSIDQPSNLYQLDSKAAVKRLKSSPLIKEATIHKIRPGTLYINYDMRVPSVYLGDYTNTALDKEGTLLPFSPFFTPKRIPILYLGLKKEEKQWGDSLKEDERHQLAFTVFQYVQAVCDKQLFLKQIDVSKAFAESYGQRQLILILEDHAESPTIKMKTYVLRLDVEDYQKNLARFLAIRPMLNPSAVTIIDLRIPYLAFIKEE